MTRTQRGETQRIYPGVTVDWHTLGVVHVDGRTGEVEDVVHMLDHSRPWSGLQVRVAWSDGSRAAYTIVSPRETLAQDGPCDSWRRH